jgi:hypothetical protein
MLIKEIVDKILEEQKETNAEILEMTQEQINKQQSFYYRKSCTFFRNPNVL